MQQNIRETLITLKREEKISLWLFSYGYIYYGGKADACYNSELNQLILRILLTLDLNLEKNYYLFKLCNETFEFKVYEGEEGYETVEMIQEISPLQPGTVMEDYKIYEGDLPIITKNTVHDIISNLREKYLFSSNYQIKVIDDNKIEISFLNPLKSTNIVLQGNLFDYVDLIGINEAEKYNLMVSLAGEWYV